MNERSVLTFEGAVVDKLSELLLSGGLQNSNRPTKQVRRFRPPVVYSPLTTIMMAQIAYSEAMRVLTSKPAELAGLLIGRQGHHAVTHFVPDVRGRSTPAMFEFDHEWLNMELKKYVALGMEALGILHSQPPGYHELSQGDLAYVRKIFVEPNNAVERVLMPVVSDGHLFPYVVDQDGYVHKGDLILF